MKLRHAWLSKLGKKASAVLEFAIFVPLLLIFLLGVSEILTLYRTAAKLNTLAGNTAQMVSLQPTTTLTAMTTSGNNPPSVTPYSVTSTKLSDICKGAAWGLQPFPSGSLAIAISSVTQTSATGATPVTYDVWEVDDACGTSSPAPAIGTTVAETLVTTGAKGSMLLFQGDNIVIVRATLNYPGIVGVFLTSAQTLTQTAYSRWRLASSTAELKCSGDGGSAGCT